MMKKIILTVYLYMFFCGIHTYAAAPTSPTGLRLLERGQSVQLSWEPVTVSPSVTDYIVEYKATSSSSWITFSDGVSVSTSTTVTGLSPNIIYNFRVSALNSDGTSLPSSVVSTRYPEIASIPNLISFWDFSEPSGQGYLSKAGTGFFPLSNAGTTTVSTVNGGPFSGYSANFNGLNQFLSIPASSVGDLNLSNFGNNATVFAVVNRDETNAGFIAGMWQEDDHDPRRQYGLFIDLPLFGGEEQVVGHISKTGSSSPGYIFSRDYSANISTFTNNTWKSLAMTYDGSYISSFYESRFEGRPTYTEPVPPNGFGETYSKNPYYFNEGLNNTNVSDFTVGAVKLTTGMDNYFKGQIGGIGIVAGSLTPEAIFSIQKAVARLNNTPTYVYDFTNTAGNNSPIALSTRGFRGLVGSSAIDTSASSSLSGGFVLINSSPIGFLARTNTTIEGPAFWYDDQSFGIPISEISNLSLRLNNANVSDTVKFAIKVSDQWYASEQSFSVASTSQSGADWGPSEIKTLTFERNKKRWRRLNVNPGTQLSIASNVESVDLPSDAFVDSFGIYSPSRPLGNVRIDDFSINTSFVQNEQAPINISPATTTISSTLSVGSTLTAFPGIWSGSPELTYTYEWLIDGVAVPNQNDINYTISVNDSGKNLSLRVTATNIYGSASSTSLITSSVPTPISLVNLLPPRISGNPSPGSVLSVITGSWSGSPSPTFSYQWKRSGVNIQNATSSTYTVLVDDLNSTLSVELIATNPVSSVQLSSNEIPISLNWTPLNLGNSLQAWYDSSDTNSLSIVSTSSVSVWLDKGPLQRNLFSTTTLSRPSRINSGLNGLPVVGFNGSSNFMFSTSTNDLMRNVSGSNISSVIIPSSVGITQRPINISNGLSAGPIRHGLFFNSLNQIGSSGRRLDSDSLQDIISTSPNISASSPMILQSNVNNLSANSSIRRNGISYATSTFQASGQVSDTNPIQITVGATGAAAQNFNGRIGEIILLNGNISNDDQLRIDGYLAHKWGLTSLLPNDHLYKNTAPSLGQFVPGIPRNITASSSSSTEIFISWFEPLSDGGSAVTDYQIQYKETLSQTWINYDDTLTDATSTMLFNIPNNKSYDFRIFAINNVGTGDYIELNNFTHNVIMPDNNVNININTNSNNRTNVISPGSSSFSSFTNNSLSRNNTQTELINNVKTNNVFVNNLTLKSSGLEVVNLQLFLINEGFLESGRNTGYFGQLTRSALIAYQKSVGINPATGFFGPKTREFVNSEVVNKKTSNINNETKVKSEIENMFLNRDLMFGSSGSDVKLLQVFLNKNGFNISEKGLGSTGFETNYFGNATRNAVIRFQKAKNITPSVGIIGPKTRLVINNLLY